MATGDGNISRYQYLTEFGAEKVEYVWTLLNFTFIPSTVSEWKSPEFFSSKLLNTSWCLTLSKTASQNSSSGSRSQYNYYTGHQESDSVFSFKVKLMSTVPDKVRAVPKLCAVYAKQQIAQYGTEKAQTFKKGDEWGPLQVTSSMLVKSAENTLIVKCEIYVLTEKVNVISSNPVQSPKCSLASDLKQMLDNQELCDVTLKIGAEDFQAHKVILSARSPVFHAMFKNDMKENRESSVEIIDVVPIVFKEVLRYMYTGKCELKDGMVEKILPVADKYQLPGLKELCEEGMVREVSIENVVEFAVEAYQFDCKRLKSKVTDFIRRNLIKVMGTDKWKECILLYPEIIVDLTSDIANS